MTLPRFADLLLLPLQGYLVGNGCTDPHFDGNAQVPFALGKSLISASLYSRTDEACGGKFYDAPEGSRCGVLVLSAAWNLFAGGLQVVCVLLSYRMHLFCGGKSYDKQKAAGAAYACAAAVMSCEQHGTCL
jgi:hypothetical protein